MEQASKRRASHTERPARLRHVGLLGVFHDTDTTVVDDLFGVTVMGSFGSLVGTKGSIAVATNWWTCNLNP